MSNIERLAGMMQAHESQQSAAVVATIAVLVRSRLNENTDKVFREAIGDVITWDVPLVNNDNNWPARKKYMSRKMFSSNEDYSKMKMVMHGYLGVKASKFFFLHDKLLTCSKFLEHPKLIRGSLFL